MKRITVTGVAGFISSNPLEVLLKFGRQVAGLDNFNTDKPSTVALNYLRQQFDVATADDVWVIENAKIRTHESWLYLAWCWIVSLGRSSAGRCSLGLIGSWSSRHY
jgi:nucleoside-diphosphate-sugar epimerase